MEVTHGLDIASSLPRMMIASWRMIRRVARRRRAKRNKAQETEEIEVTVPTHFRCPISLDMMKDPVALSSGITYDRESIEAWIEAGNKTCPASNTVLRSLDPVPNHAIRKMIQEWCVENRAFGVERIPTPRIPVSQADVREILARVAWAGERRDWSLCKEMAVKVHRLIKESERNRKCIRSTGAGAVFAEAFEELSKESDFEENSTSSEEILATMTAMLPLDSAAQSRLGSTDSLHALAWHMRNGNLSARRNSVQAIREIISGNIPRVTSLSSTEGATSGLLKLIKEPISPASTKSTLVVIYYMVTLDHPSRDKVRSEFSNSGIVSLLLETIVDAERSVCEKALGVLDGICDVEDGRKSLLSHPLSSPLLVKKLLRVSELSTEFAVSILSKIVEDVGEAFWLELLQLGAFQKLLVLLQVGCGDNTKEKATELIKSLNVRRETMSECANSQDWKLLKRRDYRKNGTIGNDHNIARDQVPPEKFYHLPNITQVINNVQVHEGDWHVDGAVKIWNYTVDGKKLTAKEKVSFDDVNKSITFVVIDGDLLKEFKSFVNIVKVNPKEDGKSILTWIIEYEKLSADVGIPVSYLVLYEKLTEEVDAHILKT